MAEANEILMREQYELIFSGPRNDCNDFRILVELHHPFRTVNVLATHNSKQKDLLDGVRLSLDGLEYVGKAFIALAEMWRNQELPERSLT